MRKILKNVSRFLVAATLLFVLSPADAQISKDTVKTNRPNDPMVINPDKPNDANAMMTDTGFIRKNIMDNMEEIQLAKAGRKKGTLPQVKKLASLMVTDHTEMLNDLKKLALKKHVLITESHLSSMPAAPEISMEQGSDFNKTWASQMLAMHQHKIKELEDFISITQDVEIKAVANKALEKIKMHRIALARIPGVKAEPVSNAVI